ncbi:MAG: hypothetical protein DRN06_03175 [Thermoprotei archaeon]|nr:MAG: hypothetical protein DRN06_03175 [Thermoprotei archaeon]
MRELSKSLIRFSTLLRASRNIVPFHDKGQVPLRTLNALVVSQAEYGEAIPYKHDSSIPDEPRKRCTQVPCFLTRLLAFFIGIVF